MKHFVNFLKIDAVYVCILVTELAELLLIKDVEKTKTKDKMKDDFETPPHVSGSRRFPGAVRKKEL